MKKIFRVVFVGGGNMAKALLGGIIGRSLLGENLLPHDVLVIDAAESQCRLIESEFSGVVTATQIDEQVNGAQIVILATKPQQLQEVCQLLAPWIKASLVISIAAGVASHSIQAWLAGHQRIIRTMPNTPALIGAGLTGLFAQQGVSNDDQEACVSLMLAVGKTLWVETEAQIDAITAISGSGPGYVFYFMESLEIAALQLGFNTTDARLLVNQTFLGAASLAAQSTETLAVLRERVTSKGGTTAAALTSFNQSNVSDSIAIGACAAYARAQTLAQEMAGKA